MLEVESAEDPRLLIALQGRLYHSRKTPNPEKQIVRGRTGGLASRQDSCPGAQRNGNWTCSAAATIRFSEEYSQGDELPVGKES